MARNKMKYPLLENLVVVDAGAEGKAVAKHEDMVVFIPFAAPGDVVDVQITKKKRNFAEGRVVKYHSKSDKRVDPVCTHFGTCGGCKWQHLSYEDQLLYKQKVIEDSFIRKAKLDVPEIPAVLPSANTEYYRNKLEFTFSNRRWFTGDMKDLPEDLNRNALGFHLPGMFDRILDIDACYLQDKFSDEIRLAVRDYAHENKLTFYDTRNKEGFLRNLIIRNTSLGEWMVIMVFHYDDIDIHTMMEFIKNKFPSITSLMYVINEKHNDTIYDLEVRLYSGQDYITEQMEDMKFRIGPHSFFQTNSVQALELYRIARDFASLSGTETVFDLYTGTGTIANFISGNAGRVVGIESVPTAVEDAKLNSKLNNVGNTVFIVGDMMKVFDDVFLRTHGKPDVIITDPPRAGMHEKVVKNILRASPQKIVYISCNPASQARDVALMSQSYKVTRIQPVDMFPHTHHVENVILLEKK